jgi:tetratricopeptide (TPR) repeat protein
VDNKIKILVLLAGTLLTLFSYAQSISEKAQLANQYYVSGELDKAEELFNKLSDNTQAIPLIHSNYLAFLTNSGEYKKAEKYLKNVLKQFPSDFNYVADLIGLYHKSENEKSLKEYIHQILSQYGSNQYQLSLLAQNLVNRDLLDLARDFYLYARRASGNLVNYSLELASVYRMDGEKDLMTEEYLNYATQHERNTRYIKNVFQQLLSEPDDLDYLEATLLDKIREFPNNILYLDLIVWVELQRKNFYGAFIQSRA